MKLSELKTGERGVVVRVKGHGGFRKHIHEMGVNKGTDVEVLPNATNHDLVTYKILDKEIQIRNAEADLIEIVGEAEAAEWEAKHPDLHGIKAVEGEDITHRVARAKGRELNVVLIGNPNCGKTSLYNVASGSHEEVGNYNGVSAEAKESEFDFNGYHFHLVDLPDIHSLTAYSPDELYVRKYIIERVPDLIINVIDASNIERNLYLTTQLLDLDVPMIIAINKYDELHKTGKQLDIQQLGRLLGTIIIPTVALTGEGVNELLSAIIDIEEGKHNIFRHIHVNHGSLIEKSISRIEQLIRVNPEPHHNYSGRFLAIKMLENDRQVEDVVRLLGNANDVFAERDACQKGILNEIKEDSESAIKDAKYGYVHGALKECFKKPQRFKRLMTKQIDSILIHPVWGYIIFFLIMYAMFFSTFNIGDYPRGWIESIVKLIAEGVSKIMADGPIKDLVVDGIISGVGGVIVFLPNIMILYAFISWMEDSGYMSRAAFIMDKIMHRMGLHGKSFIPMIMAFGCNIPAILATRTIEDKKSRLITMMIVPLMSCSARLPVYIILIGAFFPKNSALILLSLYFSGIVLSVFMAKIFSKFIVKGESIPFVMELPPYRMPSMRSVGLHTWEKGRQYLKKMGTTILVASMAVWALSYYPHNDALTHSEQLEQSYIGCVGKAIEPALTPCGLSWREGVSIISGVGAKEIVASTMSVLYNGDITTSDLTPLSALALMVLVLLYFPCVATCVAIHAESEQWKWAVFTAFYTTLLAWISSMLIFQIGSLFM